MEVIQPPADNAVVAIPQAGVVARIGADGTHRDRLSTELDVARWLDRCGVPVVRPFDELPQLIGCHGRIVTWWELINSRRSGKPSQLAILLRSLHCQTPPWPSSLSTLDPWTRIPEHIDAATGIPPEDRHFLRRHLRELQTEWESLSAMWPESFIHGDAHTGNTLDLGGGQAVLLDFERAAVGPASWDTAVAVAYHQIGWYDDDTYATYANAYGSDPANDHEMDLLVRIRLLRMTAWYASRTNREPSAVENVRHRIESLRDPRIPKQWVPG
ncbi:phosphotransferase enzyme family protein [Streptomyces endocoffeicus]